MKYIHNRLNWKLLLEARDNRDKIKKFFNNEKVINWAHELDNNYSMWIVNSFKNEILERIEEDGLYKKDVDDRKITKQDVLSILKNGGDKDIKFDSIIITYLDKIIDKYMSRLSTNYRYIFDWTKGRMRDSGIRENLRGLSLGEAWNKSDEWHKALAEGEHVIIDEEGEIIMTFKDDFYWINLQTDNCSAEGKAMGHCGSTSYGTTLYSLRKNKKPFVTIAFNEDDRNITQVKGRGNKKPVEKYHTYIVDLLINPKVDIQGFDYEYNPQDDFQINDLNDELFDKLYNGNKKIFENSKGYTNLMLFNRGLIKKEDVVNSFKDVVLDEETGDLYFTVGDWSDTAELVYEDSSNKRTLEFAQGILSGDYDSALYFSNSEKFDFSSHWEYLTIDTLNVIKDIIIKEQDGTFYDTDGNEIEFEFTDENLIVDKWSVVEKLLHPDKTPLRVEEKDAKNFGGMYFYIDEEIFDMSDILEENKDSGWMEDIVDKFNMAANDADRWSIQSKWYEHITEQVIEHLTGDNKKKEPDNRFKFFGDNNEELGFKLNVKKVLYLMDISEEGESRGYTEIADVFRHSSYDSYDMDKNKIIDIDDRGHIYGEIEKEINNTLIDIFNF